jgi:hypothetical protein
LFNGKVVAKTTIIDSNQQRILKDVFAVDVANIDGKRT